MLLDVDARAVGRKIDEVFLCTAVTDDASERSWTSTVLVAGAITLSVSCRQLICWWKVMVLLNVADVASWSVQCTGGSPSLLSLSLYVSTTSTRLLTQVPLPTMSHRCRRDHQPRKFSFAHALWLICQTLNSTHTFLQLISILFSLNFQMN